MPYSVQFVGLVCFWRERGGRRVLLPDGEHPGEGIDPHYASIVVDPGAVEDATGWNGHVTRPGMFRLPPCSLSIEGADSPGAFDATDHYKVLPELRTPDNHFEIDPETAQTIAQMSIRQGTLTAYRIPGGKALISQLDVPHDGTITITVTPRDGSEPRTLRLKPGTEIAITNMAGDDIYATAAIEPEGHFRIYEKLSVRKDVKLEPPKSLPEVLPSPSAHILFKNAKPITLAYECSNTGCC